MCSKCHLTRDIPSQDIADRFTIRVVLPTSGSTTLSKILNDTRSCQLMDDHICPCCKENNTTTEEEFVKKLPKYLIVQASRARFQEDNNGKYVRNTGKELNIQKFDTTVKFPGEAFDLSPLVCGVQSSEGHKYEAFCTVAHLGSG